MGKHSLVTVYLVLVVFAVGVNSQLFDSLKECLVDILDKAVQPKYQQNLCQLAEFSMICTLKSVAENIDLPESSIQAMQSQFDSTSGISNCHLNVRQLIQKAKDPNQSTGDDDQSPASIARRKALGVCMDTMFAKIQESQNQRDVCRLLKESVPCLVKAMSPNGEPSDEVIKGLQIGMDSQDMNGCHFDVRRILAGDDGNAAPASFSGSFWGTLAMSCLSVFVLVRGL